MTRWLSFWNSFESAIHNNPALSSVDKFNYLNSLLESTAAEAIAGLALTAANYEEAVDTLKRRFGNKQLIVSKHMDALLNLPTVHSHHDLRGFRHLIDLIEMNVRGLKALGVTAESYGGLLTSIMMNKLPAEIRLIISREFTDDNWDVERLMAMVHREIDARERSAASTGSRAPAPRSPQRRSPPTAAAFVVSDSTPTGCVFCNGGHQPQSCTVVVEANARMKALRGQGRCYLCLRKHHLSKDCRSPTRCCICRGRHHVSICRQRSANDTNSPRAPPSNNNVEMNGRVVTTNPAPVRSTGGVGTRTSTNNLSVGARTPVLLQTARLKLYNPDGDSRVFFEVRAILDGGSQRTYVTSRVKDRLNLATRRVECLRVKTFGTEKAQDKCCEVVELGVHTQTGETLKMAALTVPFVCNPVTCQPTQQAMETYEHLLGLELADSAEPEEELQVDVLVGSDVYWSLVTGDVRRGRKGPVAIHTKVGWVLSGPTAPAESMTTLAITSTHVCKTDCLPIKGNLDDQLKRFWDLESLGIMKNEDSVYQKFTQKISFDGQRYQVSLPWKDDHPPLPNNQEMCRRRLIGLLKRLRQNPPLLAEYDSVIKDQLHRGVIEVVPKSSTDEADRMHYLPHHAVVRRDKATTKLRVVYDASAKTIGPSLNECLYTGPSFGQSIFDILLRFRLHKVAIAGDIEKAFLMVSIAAGDRDSLRFLWTSDLQKESPEVTILRFTRVVFGVNCSPFLLNATIKHHIETYRDIDPLFVADFMSSIYVDDVSFGAENEEKGYQLYIKSKTRLAEAGFNLRKFVTNSDNLRQKINDNEQPVQRNHTNEVTEDDQSFAKGSLGGQNEANGMPKILGVQWNVTKDELVFDMGEAMHHLTDSKPTKRTVIGVSAKFFDPLGIVSPVTVQLKMFFQRLCEANLDWDEHLSGDLLTEWTKLHQSLQERVIITMPRWYSTSQRGTARLIGFCDASVKAYAAVVYLRVDEGETPRVCFVAAKNRVAPLGGMTIPCLELLSALLLSKLIDSINSALTQTRLVLGDPVCYTDSKVALYWIKGCHQEWKQFVENRVTTIQTLVQARHWRHCPGKDNPADVPSRGMAIAELAANTLWLSGPEWIAKIDDSTNKDADITEEPDECRQEKKATRNGAHAMTVTQQPRSGIGRVIQCEDFSSLQRLLRVTAAVLRFIRLLRGRMSVSQSTELEDIQKARLLWQKEAQAQLQQTRNFQTWRNQFGLTLDNNGLWRCRGRMSNSDLPTEARAPVILDRKHHFTSLVVRDAHQRVLHNGVKETLMQIRSEYWIVRGRQFVRSLIYQCVVCRRQEGGPYKMVQPPPLPDFRTRQSRPFSNTGVDFAGPLYVRAPDGPKVWLCLYTCCATRAVHLDLVPDMSAETFLRSFKRFTARRGTPVRMVSDNGKTFKSAAAIITRTLKDPKLRRAFENLRVKWAFNLEKAPWQGGIFERMVKSAKRCLRKAIGKTALSYDELLTLVTEVEAVLNSRPLSYVSTEDLEEPLTPSHLLMGYRVLSLPDSAPEDDPEWNPTTKQLSRRQRHLQTTLDKFWGRWRTEYLMELREFHRNPKPNRGVCLPIKEGQVVTVYDEGHPRGLWRLGRVLEVIKSSDGRVRGARVNVQAKSGRLTTLRRPIQQLYPLEAQETSSMTDSSTTPLTEGSTSPSTDVSPIPTTAPSPGDGTPQGRPRRAAAVLARDRIRDCA